LEKWNGYTPWRALEFTKEKLQASLKQNKKFSLTAHTYGADFIKGCKKIIDNGQDIPSLIPATQTPLTIIQGTIDICVPEPFAHEVCHSAQREGAPVRYVRMNGM